MFQVYSSIFSKWSQTWQDEVGDIDWGEDETEHLVDDDNLQDYLVDEIEPEEISPEAPQSLPPTAEPVVPEHVQEIPTINEYLTPDAVREVVYANVDDLLDDSMMAAPPEVVGFDYTNRHGAYAGWRTVEPHYIFHAYTTGNMVLVTWDRDVQDIRAFIVGNIHPNGVRYEGENFTPRSEIMRGIS